MSKKMQFHTCRSGYIDYGESRKEKAITMNRNERQKDGSGVPDMPCLSAILQGQHTGADPLSLVRNHYVKEYGPEKAESRLKGLSVMQVLELADKLKANEQSAGRHQDGTGVPQMPELIFNVK